MTRKFQYITEEYYSNCFFEAIKAKLRNWKEVKIYFCKPRITPNGNFQMPHFMWEDTNNSFDFSDDEYGNLPWYKCFWFKGRIRRFKRGFALKYSRTRNAIYRR